MLATNDYFQCLVVYITGMLQYNRYSIYLFQNKHMEWKTYINDNSHFTESSEKGVPDSWRQRNRNLEIKTLDYTYLYFNTK